MKNLALQKSNTRKRRFAFMLISLGVILLLLSGPLQPRVIAIQTKNGLYIPNQYYQFSPQETKMLGREMSHTFTIYNGCFKSVEVEAHADCGCTELSWSHSKILPFGQVNITASKKAANFSSTTELMFRVDNGEYVFASLRQ